ncbi:MAG: hypothetical protein JST16_04685 [Bdellovibrionales bacterium]|nr:hypothetical protein [Bdellovibrionales bacterium]
MGWFIFAIGGVVLTCWAWVFSYYPLLGHDHAAGVPAIFELHEAWSRFGIIDIDFSPFRCLGLPYFSNPNSLVWSVYQAAALVFSEINAIFVVMLFFILVSFFGAFRLCRALGFRADLASVLSLGWCVQGFCMTHALSGHSNYLQFALLPFFLWIVLQPQLTLVWSGALAFWLAHLLYTSGYYVLLIGLPSVALAVVFLWWLLGAPRMERLQLAKPWVALRNLLVPGLVAILMTLPKILGSLNFSAMFPREMSLERVGLLNGFLYTTLNFFYPFPYDVRFMTGWWYGNWESYEFIFPGVIFAMIWLLYRHRQTLPVRKAVLAFGIILVAGTLLSSGALAPVFEHLPVFKSLHVNPRWNSFVMLPYFVWIMALLRLAGIEGVQVRLPAWALGVFAALALGVPFIFFDKETFQINYPDRAGIALEQGKLTYCYEPIFGYGLETFPLGRQVNWMADVSVDPRCYLKSNQCKPGTLFGEPGTVMADREKLLRYELRDEYAPVKNFKRPSLVIYLAGLIAALAACGALVKDAWLWVFGSESRAPEENSTK